MNAGTTVEAHAKAWRAKMRGLEATLDERERAVLRQRLESHPPERTQRALGAEMGLSGARINQIERRLRRKIEAHTAHETRAVAAALGATPPARASCASALERALPGMDPGGRTLLAGEVWRARTSARMERAGEAAAREEIERERAARRAGERAKVETGYARAARALRTGVIASSHRETRERGEGGAGTIVRNLMQWWYAPHTGWRERVLERAWCEAMAAHAPGGNLKQWLHTLEHDPSCALGAHAQVESRMRAEGGWGWAVAYTAVAAAPAHGTTTARALGYLAACACSLGPTAERKGMAGVAEQIVKTGGAMKEHPWKDALARARAHIGARTETTLGGRWLDALGEEMGRAREEGVLSEALALAWRARKRTGELEHAQAQRSARRARASTETAARIARGARGHRRAGARWRRCSGRSSTPSRGRASGSSARWRRRRPRGARPPRGHPPPKAQACAAARGGSSTRSGDASRGSSPTGAERGGGAPARNGATTRGWKTRGMRSGGSPMPASGRGRDARRSRGCAAQAKGEPSRHWSRSRSSRPRAKSTRAQRAGAKPRSAPKRSWTGCATRGEAGTGRSDEQRGRGGGEPARARRVRSQRDDRASRRARRAVGRLPRAPRNLWERRPRAHRGHRVREERAGDGGAQAGEARRTANAA